MSGERIYILDKNGNMVNDPADQDAMDYATNIAWQTAWPNGYMGCTFQIRVRDIVGSLGIKEGYTVLVMDGLDLVYDGRVQSVSKSIQGLAEVVDIEAHGWIVAVQERLVMKRWIDKQATKHMAVPPGRFTNEYQSQWAWTQDQNGFRINGPNIDEDFPSEASAGYWLRYYGYGTIDEVQFNYKGRTGERFVIEFFRTDNGASTTTSLYSSGDLGENGGADPPDNFGPTAVTASLTSTSAFDWVMWPKGVTNPDQYDQSDWCACYGITILVDYDGSHPNAGAPTYTVTELMKDTFWVSKLFGNTVSSYTGDWANITTVVDEFAIESPIPVTEAFKRLADFSDTDYRTYGLSVWDRNGTPDNLPRTVVDYYDTSDYDYVINLGGDELQSFTNSIDISQLYNYIWVTFSTENGMSYTIGPDQEPTLTDTTSINDYFRREQSLQLGQMSHDQALQAGVRFLTLHKDPIYTGTISLTGRILRKNGAYQKLNKVKAGERFYIPQFDKTFVIRQTSYNSEAESLTISPANRPNSLPFFLADIRKKAEANKPNYDGAGW